MSWTSELDPTPLTLRSLIKVLIEARLEYRNASLPLIDSLVFLGLKVVQSVAYTKGWESVAKTRSHEGHAAEA